MHVGIQWDVVRSKEVTAVKVGLEPDACGHALGCGGIKGADGGAGCSAMGWKRGASGAGCPALPLNHAGLLGLGLSWLMLLAQTVGSEIKLAQPCWSD